MEPTTTGKGPFKPAIRFADQLFVNISEHDREEDAANFAIKAVKDAEVAIRMSLKANRFYPQR